MKKYFLTTALMGTFIAPAFGADKIITSANTCTMDVLGVSDNNAVANTIATWDLESYECPAGQYLNVTEDTIECTECPTGSYCPGGTYTVESENKGATTCPADYTSDSGAGMQTQCYTDCSVNCTQQSVPEHAINVTHGSETVNGKLYYGGSCDAVVPVCSMDFKCATGYHKHPDLTDEQLVSLIVKMMGVNSEDVTSEMLEQIKKEYFGNWETLEVVASTNPEFQMLQSEIVKLQHPGTSSSGLLMQPYIDLGSEIASAGSSDNLPLGAVGYVYAKQFNGEGKCSSFTKLGTLYNFEWSVVDCDTLFQQNADIQNFHNMAQNGDWFLTIPGRNIVMHGKAECRQTEYDSGGGYLGYYSLKNVQGVAMSGPWELAVDSPYSYESCLSSVMNIAPAIPLLTAAVCSANNNSMSTCEQFSDLWQITSSSNNNSYITYVCSANTINIDWNPDNGGEHIKNMCTYEGSIELPTPDPVKPGYTFTGWKLVE